jgi:methionyl-tRNA formyltransferase
VKSVYFQKLYPLGIKMIAEAVRLIREGKATPTEQDESLASFEPVICASDTVIDWTQSTEKVYNLIRGANPSPGAVTKLGEQKCVFYDAAPSDQTAEPGTVIEIARDSFTVATGDGAITVSSAKPPGQKKLAAAEFVASLNLKVGDRFIS